MDRDLAWPPFAPLFPNAAEPKPPMNYNWDRGVARCWDISPEPSNSEQRKVLGGPYRQEDLRGAADHLDVLVVQQAAADRDDVVVLGGQLGVQHRRHQAARPVLHPPRAVQ